MADKADPGRPRTATTEVREWIRDRVDPTDRGVAPRIAEEAVAWLQTDADLLDRFLYEQVFNTTAEIVRAVMLETRRVKRFTQLAEESEPQRRESLRQWLDRREHVNPEVGYVRLGAMTAAELILAASEREGRARRDLAGARWYRMLAADMTEGQTVEDRYTPGQIEEAYERASATLTSRMEGIMAGAEQAMKDILYPDTDNPTTEE